MTVQSETPRYEIKIRCPTSFLPQIEAWIRLYPAHWRILYPPRQVNNVYFDTADCRNVDENLDGVAERHKLRLRWYGPVLERVAGARLELKRREGAVGWKEVCPVDVLLDLGQEAWSAVCASLRATSDPQLALWFSALAYPTLINCYQRAYYATPDQAVRLTVDTGLRVYDQRFCSRPNLSRAAAMPDQVIVELKAAVEHLPRLADVLGDLPLRPDRYSKYVHGLLTGPDYEGVAFL